MMARDVLAEARITVLHTLFAVSPDAMSAAMQEAIMAATDAYALAVLDEVDELLEAGLNSSQAYSEAKYLLSAIREAIREGTPRG